MIPGARLLPLPLALAVSASGSEMPAPPALVFTHVTVIDATGAPPRPGMTVVVADGRIRALGRDGEVPRPDPARVIDARGST